MSFLRFLEGLRGRSGDPPSAQPMKRRWTPGGRVSDLNRPASIGAAAGHPAAPPPRPPSRAHGNSRRGLQGSVRTAIGTPGVTSAATTTSPETLRLATAPIRAIDGSRRPKRHLLRLRAPPVRGPAARRVGCTEITAFGSRGSNVHRADRRLGLPPPRQSPSAHPMSRPRKEVGTP